MTDRDFAVWEQAVDHARETALLASIQELLEWDERTQLPSGAGEYRAEQVTKLAGLTHRRRTDPRLGGWLEQLAASPLAADPHSDTGAAIAWMRRDYEKQKRLPPTLVEALARTAVLSQQAWAEARKKRDYALFQPLLGQTIRLKQQQAEALGYQRHAYDPLLDDYEPGETTDRMTQVLADLREQLTPLVAQIVASGRRPNRSILSREYPLDVQASFGRWAAETIGFDFRRGRLDVSDHPFCCTLGPHDCRITTRYQRNFLPSSLFGILHEAGHGIYEQGLRTDQYGLPPGTAISLGIHESQSRLWENLVGRSESFWRFCFPAAQKAFPSALGEVTLHDFYAAINDVRPSLIRVEADEATYNLHIILRFELEQDLLSGELTTGELPAAWDAKYRDYLGLQPVHAAEGVLQDIHWSAGLIGYFPTYALGNLYAAQLFECADAELGGLETLLCRGAFGPLHQWLTERIFRHGRRFSASQLLLQVTGAPLSHRPLLRHLRRKLAPLFGLEEDTAV